MRHIHHYQGRQFIEDSEIPKTHIVLGQRNEANDKPSVVNPMRMTDKEQVAMSEYTFNLVHGWYAMRPLAWAVSSDNATQLAAGFTAPEWINVRIVELDPQAIIKYA